MKFILVLVIVSFFSALIYFLSQKFNSKLLTTGLIFAISVVLGYFVPLSISNETLVFRALGNLLPATVFLFSLDLDYKKVFGSQIGCSCKMGAKRYWLIVLLAFGATFVSQFIALQYTFEPIWAYAILFAFVLGVIFSFTPLKYLNGTAEVATTMLYLSTALGGISIQFLKTV